MSLEFIEEAKGLNEEFSCFTISPDGSLMATGNSNGSVNLILMDNGSNLYTFDAQSGVNAVVFSPNHYSLAIATLENIQILNLENKQVLVKIENKFEGQFPSCKSLFILNNFLYASYTDNKIRKFELKN